MTTGMRVFFSEGSRVVQDVSIYYGGMGPTTVCATKTCTAIVSRSDTEFSSTCAFLLLSFCFNLLLPFTPSSPFLLPVSLFSFFSFPFALVLLFLTQPDSSLIFSRGQSKVKT